MTRTIQQDDLLNLYFLNGAALSPDASKVIYTVNKINAEDDKEYSTLYMLDLASGETRQMTSGRSVDAGARWSPDGKTIAFVSDRAGKPQLHMLPADGGEARQLTASNAASAAAWLGRPTGSKIAYLRQARRRSGRPVNRALSR